MMPYLVGVKEEGKGLRDYRRLKLEKVLSPNYDLQNDTPIQHKLSLYNIF
jgi:hypothetical protein